jgi:transposase, IS6 family
MENVDFKWKHYQPEIIMVCVRWYLKFALSYRNLKEIMLERGIEVDQLRRVKYLNWVSSRLYQLLKPFKVLKQ